MALKYEFLSSQGNVSALVQTKIQLTNREKSRSDVFEWQISQQLLLLLNTLSGETIIKKDLTTKHVIKKIKERDNNDDDDDDNNNNNQIGHFPSHTETLLFVSAS